MFEQLTPEEKMVYLENLYNKLLEHRYRYYVLNHGVLSDFEYDWIEKEYNRMASEHGVKLMEMVDFNPNDPLAIEAKKRVDSDTDSYSLWEKEMRPIWDKLGMTKKQKAKNE